ncbi:hypothetical protein CSKR_110634 [Clonorchis sinensis]|uniref:Uncharacterized protein n=1 Tax=Clonorchis sinensis TaxID=79923 RepID=A0A3R7EMJ8_CLOSI|nr:hypothetical protein CSKR_110634 [Clonorchis sinensis]
MQANATKRLHKFRNKSHFSREAKRIYEKTYYSHASSVASTVTPAAILRPREPFALRNKSSETENETCNFSVVELSTLLSSSVRPISNAI